MYRLAVALEDPDALDLAQAWGRRHPVDRIRLASFQARAALCDDPAARDALWREAEQCDSRLVAEAAREERARL